MNQALEKILRDADIRLDGERPWDLKVHDSRALRRWAIEGSMGMGTSYMDGWWDCEALDELVYRILRLDPHHSCEPWWSRILAALIEKTVNLQSLSRAFQVGQQHYDIGDDLYIRMLDSSMTYSCAYWQGGAHDLGEAQSHKLKLICDKLELGPGMRVLDIGCGWGSFCHYAAEHYGVEVVGLTISKAQQAAATVRCRDLPVEIRLQDYRTYEGIFDRIVSVGMFEHVGPKNYRTYLDRARQCLKPDGLFLLHTIGSNQTEPSARSWYTKYIFPNGYLPSISEMAKAMEKRFIVEDLHNFGADYDPTLIAWYHRFVEAWPHLKGTRPQYTERFQRMWRFYLLSCAGGFRSRTLQLWQWVLSPMGVPGGYRRPSPPAS